jgi:hypothetical protein
MSTALTAPPARDWDALAAALASAMGAASRLRREEPLGPRTTLRVGGVVDSTRRFVTTDSWRSH